jgi:hypothetical protein
VVPDKVDHFALVNWVTTTSSREPSFRLDERGGMPGVSMAWDVTSFRAICLGEQSLVIHVIGFAGFAGGVANHRQGANSLCSLGPALSVEG